MKQIVRGCLPHWLIVGIILLLPPLAAQGQRREAGRKKQRTIVFVCEHGAAKSIVAAAHFNELARKRGLNMKAIARGTNPDKALAPKAVEGLRADGLVATESAPKKISPADLVGAKRVVTFCTLPEDYAGKVKVEQWNDDLPISEQYGKARDRLVERINRLLSELKTEK